MNFVQKEEKLHLQSKCIKKVYFYGIELRFLQRCLEGKRVINNLKVFYEWKH